MSRPTLPGDIEGLLRRGSPVVVTVGHHAGQRGIVTTVHADGAVDVALDAPEVTGLLSYAADGVALDLTDPTGRAHAAWWLDGQEWDDVDAAIREHVASLEPDRVIQLWCSGDDCAAASIEAMRRTVLAVAGREVTP